MPLFRTPVWIVYLGGHSLTVYTDPRTQKFALELPLSMVKNQEVIDPKGLESALFEIIKKAEGKKPNVQILLAPDIVYHKVVPASDMDNEEYEQKSFLEDIPFEPPEIASSSVRSDANLTLFAVNKNFIYAFKNIFTKYGWEVTQIVPIAAYGDFGPTDLTPDEVARIDLAQSTGVDADLLHDNEKVAATVQKEGAQRLPWLLMLMIVSLLFMATMVLIRLKPELFGVARKIPVTPAPVPVVATSAAQIPPVIVVANTPIPVSTTFEKKNTTVQIVDRSGNLDLANRVKDRLTGAGFETITFATQSALPNTGAQVQFNSGVSNPLRGEVRAILSSLFPTIVTSETPSTTFGIVIFTGQ
ncbi:MAG: hypothetical protein ABI758_04040 [Candidatus Woesebacteria bacterium]